MERKYFIQVDSYGAPAAPLVEPCSCSPCQPSDLQCYACDAAQCEEEKYQCLPGGMMCPGCPVVRETYMKNGQKYLIAKTFTKITAMYNQAISANVAKKLNFQRRSVERWTEHDESSLMMVILKSTGDLSISSGWRLEDLHQNDSTKDSMIIQWQPNLKIANQTFFKSLKVAKRECSEQPQEKCSLVPKEVKDNR